MAADTVIDLQQFCDPTVVRYDVGEPWVIGGWRVATDCVWLVGVKTDEPDTADDKYRPIVIEMLKAAADFAGDWHNMPDAGKCKCRKLADGSTCPACLGAKQAECDECNGDCEVECYHCGQQMVCDDCEGTGKVDCEDCEECDGEGVFRFDHEDCRCAVALGGENVRGSRFDVIAQLPNVKWATMADGRVLLKFDGGYGVLMGLTKLNADTVVRRGSTGGDE